MPIIGRRHCFIKFQQSGLGGTPEEDAGETLENTERICLPSSLVIGREASFTRKIFRRAISVCQ